MMPLRTAMRKRCGRSSLLEECPPVEDPTLLASPMYAILLGLPEISVVRAVLVSARAMCSRLRVKTSFTNSILHVLLLRSKEQMVGVNASPVVARVAHDQAIGDLPFIDGPRRAMGTQHLAVDTNLPIAPSAKVAHPVPARTLCRAINIPPEPVTRAHSLHVFGWLTIAALLSGCVTSAKTKATPFNGRWQFCEIVPQKQLACLEEEDVKALRETLIRCGK